MTFDEYQKLSENDKLLARLNSLAQVANARNVIAGDAAYLHDVPSETGQFSSAEASDVAFEIAEAVGRKLTASGIAPETFSKLLTQIRYFEREFGLIIFAAEGYEVLAQYDEHRKIVTIIDVLAKGTRKVDYFREQYLIPGDDVQMSKFKS